MIEGRRKRRFAAGFWKPLAEMPPPGRSYLIAASYGGIETFDVAFYNGQRKDGSDWWTLGDVEISPECITHFAELRMPVLAKTEKPPLFGTAFLDSFHPPPPSRRARIRERHSR